MKLVLKDYLIQIQLEDCLQKINVFLWYKVMNSKSFERISEFLIKKGTNGSENLL